MYLFFHLHVHYTIQTISLFLVYKYQCTYIWVASQFIYLSIYIFDSVTSLWLSVGRSVGLSIKKIVRIFLNIIFLPPSPPFHSPPLPFLFIYLYSKSDIYLCVYMFKIIPDNRAALTSYGQNKLMFPHIKILHGAAIRFASTKKIINISSRNIRMKWVKVFF